MYAVIYIYIIIDFKTNVLLIQGTYFNMFFFIINLIPTNYKVLIFDFRTLRVLGRVIIYYN